MALSLLGDMPAVSVFDIKPNFSLSQQTASLVKFALSLKHESACFS